MSRHLAALTCTSLTIALAACGGGDGAVGTPGVAPAPATPSTVTPAPAPAPSPAPAPAPSPSPTPAPTPAPAPAPTPAPAPAPTPAPAPALPAAGIWTVVAAANGIGAGDYTQGFDPVNYSTTPMETTEGQVGNIIQIQPTLKTLGAAEDADGVAQVTLSFDADTPTKYVVTVQTLDSYFACVNGYTTEQVAELAALQEILANLSACSGTLTLDVTNRSITSTGLTLSRTGEGNSGSKLVLKVNANWPLSIDPNTGKITP